MEGEPREENPYKPITGWFDRGHQLNIAFQTSDKERIHLLKKVDGLKDLVKKYFPHANEKQSALLMEFVLHGLSAYSLISKQVIGNQVGFRDLIGSMMNLGKKDLEEEFDEES
jgi:magnesium chelatase subunit I